MIAIIRFPCHHPEPTTIEQQASRTKEELATTIDKQGKVYGESNLVKFPSQ